MSRSFPALCTPIDPVVAIHSSSGEADATLRILRQAGYDRDMLAVVGRSGDHRSAADLPRDVAAARRSWTASGPAWGALWALLTVAGTLAMPATAGGVSALLVLGAFALVVQVHVAWRAAMHARSVPGPIARARDAGAGAPTGACRFLVVVRGSRSEIALARDILAH